MVPCGDPHQLEIIQRARYVKQKRHTSTHCISAFAAILLKLSWFPRLAIMQNWTARVRGPAREAGEEPDGDKDTKEIITLVAKLCLKHAVAIRELQAAVLTTMMVPKGIDRVEQAKAATKEHAEKFESTKSVTANRTSSWSSLGSGVPPLCQFCALGRGRECAYGTHGIGQSSQ